jgi:hypothetical protein
MDAMLIEWKKEIPGTGMQVHNTFLFPDDHVLITASEDVQDIFYRLHLIS